MDELAQRLQGLLLSATELKAITDWPDELVEDYIETIRNIVLIATQTDVNTGQVDQNTQDIAQNTSDISDNATNIAQNASDITDLQNDKADKFEPSAADNIALLDVAGNLSDSTFQISDLLTQSFAGNPETNVTSNLSRLCVDTVGNQIYFNPTVGVNTGWVAV